MRLLTDFLAGFFNSPQLRYSAAKLKVSNIGAPSDGPKRARKQDDFVYR